MFPCAALKGGIKRIFKGCLHILLRNNREVEDPVKEERRAMMDADGVSGWLFCGFYGDGFMMFLLEEIACYKGNWNIGFDCLRTSFSI